MKKNVKVLIMTVLVLGLFLTACKASAPTEQEQPKPTEPTPAEQTTPAKETHRQKKSH